MASIKSDFMDFVGLLHSPKLGKYPEALKYYQQALRMQQELHEGEDHADVAQALNNVGIAYQKLGNRTKALKMQQKLLEGEHPDEVAVQLGISGALDPNLVNHTQALQCFIQALQMYQRLYEGNHPTVALVLNKVAKPMSA